MKSLRSSELPDLPSFLDPSLPAQRKLINWNKIPLFVDTNRSPDRMEWSLGNLVCVRPRSQIFCTQLQRYMRVDELWAAQQMYPEDIPHWDKYSDSLKKDLAGNAFTTGVILAKFLALFIHSRALQSLATTHADSPETAELAAMDGGHVKRRRLHGKQRPADGPASAAAAAKPRRCSCTKVVLNRQSGREELNSTEETWGPSLGRQV